MSRVIDPAELPKEVLQYIRRPGGLFTRIHHPGRDPRSVWSRISERDAQKVLGPELYERIPTFHTHQDADEYAMRRQRFLAGTVSTTINPNHN